MALELRTRLLGPLASLVFHGMEADKGGAFLGQGVGVTSPQTIIAEKHPSLFFSEALVPPTVPHVLGPSES